MAGASDRPGASVPDSGEDGRPAGPCRGCGAPTVADQRYCLRCGALVGERRLDPLRLARGEAPFAEPDAGGAPVPGLVPVLAPAAPGEPEDDRRRISPIPLTAVAAVVIAAASGVAAGGSSVSAPRAYASGTPAPAATTATTPAPTPPADGGSSDAPATADAAATPDAAAPDTSEVAAADPETTADPPAADPPAADPPPTPDPPLGPESTAVGHVWLIALQGPGAAAAVDGLSGGGVQLTAATTLTRGPLANGLGLVAGAPPTPRTRAGCGDAVAGTAPAADDPCSLPATTASIPAALATAQKPWRAYFDVVPDGRPADAAVPAGACDLPAAGDAGGAALSARSPFAHLVGLRGGSCSAAIRSLGQLAGDVADAASTASFSYLALGGCGAPGGTPAPRPVGDQLRDALQTITTGPAYAQDGVVVVTTIDDAAANCAPGAAARSSRRAVVHGGQAGNAKAAARAFPGDPAAPAGAPSPTVVYSPWTPPGSTSATAYGALSVTRTIATVLGVPAPGAAADAAVPALGTDVLGRAAPGAAADSATTRARPRRAATPVSRR